MRGPVAPKDPVEKRPCLYVLLDKIIAGAKGTNGIVQDHIYLDGRMLGQVQLASGKVDEEILNLLKDVPGTRKLVHSIGVSIISEEDESKELEAEFQVVCYGRSDKYVTGSRMEMTVPCNGVEMELQLGAFPINEEDTIIGEFAVTLPKENQNFSITVKFYLNDGYHVPEILVDPPVNFESEAYQAMIANSLVSTGNNYRLKRVIERAKAGEDVTIAYIGGSITQGAGAKPINTLCYTYRSYEAFAQMFSPNGGKNIHYVKAGIGGTSSELGVVRYERDVTNNGEIQPDLVIVEYAVNDEGDETKGVCYESLVKKILSAKNQPAILLNFAVFMDDFNLQDRLQPVGERYDLPMVSVKDALLPQYHKDMVVSKRQYFYDIFHPSNIGHHIMADCLIHLFKTVDQEEMSTADINLEQQPVYGNQFSKLVCFDRKNADDFCKIETVGFDATDTEVQCVERDMDLSATPVFLDNWMNVGTKDASFKFQITCKNLLIVMKDSGDAKFGIADAYVDGKLVRSMNPLEIGWNHSSALVLIDDTESALHEVEIRMQPGSESKKFTIQAFALTK